MTLEDPQAKVVVEKSMTENFNVDVGVRQGHALSLFHLALVILKRNEISGEIYKLKWYRFMNVQMVWS
jgi:hypothetical protein